MRSTSATRGGGEDGVGDGGARGDPRGEGRGGRGPGGRGDRGDRGADAEEVPDYRDAKADVWDRGRYYAEDARAAYRGRGEYVVRGHPHPHPHLHAAADADPQASRDWYYNASPVRSRYHHAASTSGGLFIRSHAESATLPRHSSTLETLLRGGPPSGAAALTRRPNVGIQDDVKRSAPAVPLPRGAERPKATRGRATPYLTEADRQDIMDRIRRGEKQADLAKEYNVSRAAITNLKQRRQMLEMLENSANEKDREEAQKRRRLSHGNPMAASGSGGPGGAGLGGAGLAPQRELVGGGLTGEDSVPAPSSSSSNRRKRRYSSDAESDGSASNESSAVEPAEESGAAATWTPPETLSRPACHRELNQYTTSRLLATLFDPQTPETVFRAAVARHMRLLLEETIGWSYSQTPDRYEPFALSFGSEEARILLDEYCRMEPATPFAELHAVQQRTHGQDTELVVRVPAAARLKAPVLVFLDDIVHQPDAESSPHEDTASSPRNNASPSPAESSGGGAGAAPLLVSGRESTRQCLFLLNSLVYCGVPEHKIVLVVSMCVESVARQVALRFPDVHVVTSRFLSDRAPAEEKTLLENYRARRHALLQMPSSSNSTGGESRGESTRDV